MTAFASQRRVVALERDETGDTEPGARANESDRSAWARFASADLRHVGCVESRNRERESSEVVQHQQPGEPKVRFSAPMEKLQSWFVMVTRSPMTGLAIPNAPQRGRGAPSSAR